MDAVLGALAQAVPERVPADGEGGNTLITLGGYHDGRPFVYVELFSGARGAGAWRDGQEGVPHPGSNNANTPIEIAEAGFPLLFEWYGMVPDTGGAGKYRGALAQTRQFRYLASDTIMQLRSDKRRFPPYGLHGGQPGTPSVNVINPGKDNERMVATIGIAPLRHDEVFRHVLAGGGGWGDPLERDPALVRTDVWNEKLSIDKARADYGVVLDSVSLAVNDAATAELRQQLRQLNTGSGVCN
jgi:N-methylhydantoinase B